MTTEVNDYGCALLPQLLTPAECRKIIDLWDEPGHFRATINLRRYRFGDHGDYNYFVEPFPDPVAALWYRGLSGRTIRRRSATYWCTATTA